MSVLKKIEGINRIIIYKIIGFYHKIKLNSNKSHIKYDKFLIFRYDAIGDMIVTTPVFSYLKKINPTAQIDILTSSRNNSVVKNDPRLSNIFILPSKFIDQLRLMNKLKKENYNFVFCFVLSKTGNAAFYANLISGSNTRVVAIKHSDERRNKLYSGMFDIQVDTEDLRNKMTMAELQVKIVARALKFDESKAATKLNLFLSESNTDYVKIFLKENDILSSFIVLNVSSGNEYRTWSIVKNKELLEQILRENEEMIVVLSYAPDDKEKAQEISLVSQTRIILFDSQNDFMNTCALIAQSAIVITPDTSIVHVAASFRVPVLVLYTRLSSYLNEWAPFGVEYEMVVTEGREPIETLSVESVVEAYERLIKKVHPE